MVGDDRSTDPTAQLRVALAEFSRDPMTVGAEEPLSAVECDADVALAVLLVQCTGEGVHDPSHDRVPTLTGVSPAVSPMNSLRSWWIQRIFDSW